MFFVRFPLFLLGQSRSMSGSGSYRNKPLVYVPRTPALPAAPSVRRKWWHIPLRALRKTCTAVGAIVLALSILGALSTLGLLHAEKQVLPDSFVLFLALDGSLPEKPEEISLSRPFGKQKLSVFQTVEALSLAEKDNRVKGIIVDLGNAGLNVANIQELRGAIKHLRAAGKIAWVYAPSYGNAGTGLGTYYLASAFDQIWMQPLGTLSIAGIGMEVPYVRGLLDKIGVEPQFFQRKEYKTAFESVMNSEMTPQNREMMTAMIESIGGQILSETAADRGIDPVILRSLIDKGLLLGSEAVKAKLIDKLDYDDVLLEEMRKKLGLDPKGDDPPLVDLADYHGEATSGKKSLSSLDSTSSSAEAHIPVALIYVNGTIVEGDPESASMSPLMLQGETASASEISGAISDAGDDPDISAIVIRIDSPGGSPGASETIRHAILGAKKNGKKIIVSMGAVAASGGYWVATPADTIFASPATLTGSIGVVGGKVSVAGLSEKLGVTWEAVRWGENSDLWSFSKPFSERGSERINAMLDEVYQAFITRVAKGRKMKPEQVERIARGRVWTGEQAKAIGLVDSLGGMNAALDYTARQLGLADRFGLDIRIMPKPKTPIEEIFSALGQKASASLFLQNGIASAPELGQKMQSLLNAAATPRAFVIEPALIPNLR